MTNLTPEQRVDKNGKLVTRHIKSKTPTSNVIPLPQVQPIDFAKFIAPTSPSLSQFTEMIEQRGEHWLDEQQIIKKATLIDSLAPETLTEILRLTTTGDQSTQDRTLDATIRIIQSSSLSNIDMERVSTINTFVSVSWHASELTNELSGTDDDYDKLKNRIIKNINLVNETGAVRGAAVFCAVRTNFYFARSISKETPESLQEAVTFSRWAEHQPNAKAIIRVVMERDTLNPTTIQPIIDLQTTVAPSVTNGLL